MGRALYKMSQDYLDIKYTFTKNGRKLRVPKFHRLYSFKNK